MKMIFNLLFGVVDIVSSMIVSVIHLMRDYGVDIVKYLLIAIVLVVTVRITHNVRKRFKLVRTIQELFREKNTQLQFLRSPYRSLFDRKTATCDLQFTVRERNYFVRLYPGVTTAKFIYIFPTGEVVAQGRFAVFLCRLIRRQFLRKQPLTVAKGDRAQGEEVLLFSPNCISISQADPRDFSHKEDYTVDDGICVANAIVYNQDAFLKQLERLLDGYTDSFEIRSNGTFS